MNIPWGGIATIIFIIAVVLVLVLAYFLYRNYIDNSTLGPAGPGPSGPSQSPPDSIIITNEGTRFATGTETYISMPDYSCQYDVNVPSWCANIGPTNEIRYVYDPINGGINETGSFITTFNNQTNLCSDDTSDCIYTEKFNDERILIGIFNSKGENYIEKLTTDLWSNKIIPSPQTIESWMKSVAVENGVLYYLLTPDRRLKVIPGGSLFISDFDENSTEIRLPIGQVITVLLLYYKFSNKPAPIININMKSDMSLGDSYAEYKRNRPQVAPTPQTSNPSLQMGTNSSSS